MKKSDIQYMQQALLLAKSAARIASPNPGVGCIIVKNEEIIGNGATMAAGGDHAEIRALKDCQQRGHSAAGATMYLTLEPCSHYGKTPPCVYKLIEAGITKVIIAVEDPFSEVSGRGIALLKEAKIATHVGLLAKEAQEVHRGFFARIKRGYPWVSLKIASSMDGRAALNNKKSKWLTSEAARHDVQILRSEYCAVLTGSGTVLADNPRLTVRNFKSLQPQRFVIDGQLRTSSAAIIYAEGNAHIFTIVNSQDQLGAYHNNKVSVINAINNRYVDLPAVLKEIGAYGINNLLVEAGPGLAGAMVRAKLVDEVIMYMAPMYLGHKAMGIFAWNEITDIKQAISFKLQSATMVGPDLKLTCSLKDDLN